MSRGLRDARTTMGALVSLDAFHSVGVMPVDVKAIGADFLTGGVLKWLCGGPGGCFIYSSPEVTDRMEPALTGWLAHARPFAFEADMEYTGGAYRWLNGTPAIPSIYAAIEGPRLVRKAGIDADPVEEHSTDVAPDRAGGRARLPRPCASRPCAPRRARSRSTFPTRTKSRSACSTGTSWSTSVPAPGSASRPTSTRVMTSSRTPSAAIDEILATGAWSKYAGRSSVVT